MKVGPEGRARADSSADGSEITYRVGDGYPWLEEARVHALSDRRPLLVLVDGRGRLGV